MHKYYARTQHVALHFRQSHSALSVATQHVSKQPNRSPPTPNIFHGCEKGLPQEAMTHPRAWTEEAAHPTRRLSRKVTPLTRRLPPGTHQWLSPQSILEAPAAPKNPRKCGVLKASKKFST